MLNDWTKYITGKNADDKYVKFACKSQTVEAAICNVAYGTYWKH